MNRMLGKLAELPIPLLAAGGWQTALSMQEMPGWAERLSSEAVGIGFVLGVVGYLGWLVWKTWLEHQDRTGSNGLAVRLTDAQLQSLDDIAEIRRETAKLTDMLAGRVGDTPRERFYKLYDDAQSVSQSQERIMGELLMIRELLEERLPQ